MAKKKKPVDKDAAVKALQEFVEAVNVTGGVLKNDDGNDAPVGDPDWSDLGLVYLDACKALGRTPERLDGQTCPKTNGEHVPNWTTASPADDLPGVVDVNCAHCGRSGAVAIDEKDVEW